MEGTSGMSKVTAVVSGMAPTTVTQVAAPTPVHAVAPLPAPAHPIHAERPEKFGGMNFKRWHQKMLFYLTTLGLARLLTEDPPVMQEGENNHDSIRALDAWKHSDFLCKNYILNSLENTIYGVYFVYKTAKSLWQALEKKYKTEDAGAKKFIVGKFLDFKMVDTKTVVSQVEELQMIISEILEEDMFLSESFQVAAVIEKLPPSWREFKSYLKHKRKEMNMEDLVVRLRIEEDNKKSENGTQIGQSKSNVVESSNKGKKRKFKSDASV